MERRAMNEYLNNKVFESMIGRFQDSKKKKIKLALIIDEIRETIDRKKIRKVDAAKNRKDLKEKDELLSSTSNDHEDYKEKLAYAFFTLSENIVRYAKFQLIDADDAIQEGVLICFDKIDRFDSRKGKAFNYMTTCILNHFRQLYRTARNYNELKKKYLDHIQILENKSIFKNGKPMFEHQN
jgi:hypothetical protein